MRTRLILSVVSLTFVTALMPVTLKSVSRRISSVYQRPTNRELNDLRLDENTLSDEEKARLAFIQKLTNEADEFVKEAGFDIDGNIEERDVVDTKWSGQGGLDVTRVSKSNWEDMLTRPGLLCGDMAAFTLFASIGRSNHGEGIDILNVLGTAFPFMLFWVAISPLLGAYTRKATANLKQIPIELIFPWAVSMPCALALRGFLRDAIPPTPFIIVTLVSTFLILTLWRVVYIALVGETSDEEYRRAGSLEIFKMIGSLMKRW
jgi:hypothetical protein